MPQQNLAVIGAGPKAAALAAKAACLQKQGYDVHVAVYERSEIGANWTGRHGYTDGLQRLCTAAERDLGFPYLATFGEDVVEQMQAEFSWNAFEVNRGYDDGRYAEWVNRGRRPPTHAEFAEYLRFAFTRAGVTPSIGRVQKIRRDGDTWTVRQRDAATGDIVEDEGFHGVVFTGPGPSAKKPPQVKDSRVLCGVDFWSNLFRVRKLIRKLKEHPIVIIGGGGTAAAITAWFVREGVRQHPITLLNNQAMLFTRTSNFFESRLFDDDDTWRAVDPDERAEFTKRLNRGVVWETVTDILTDAENLQLVPGTADRIEYAGPKVGNAPRPLQVAYTNNLGPFTAAASIVVDATGFNPYAFEALTPAEIRAVLAPDGRKEITKGIREDLSLPIDGWPPIHVPNLADRVGPGFGSLMVLGSMADRILNPYVQAAEA